MPVLEVTQYLRPDARQEVGGFDVSEETYEKGSQFLAKGGRFTAEVVPGGLVHICAEFEGEDVSSILVPNGEGLVTKFEGLVRKVTQ